MKEKQERCLNLIHLLLPILKNRFNIIITENLIKMMSEMEKKIHFCKGLNVIAKVS